MSRTNMFLLGCLGGAIPLIVNLLSVDLAPIIDHPGNLTLGNYVGYAIRIVALVVLGGIVAALNTGVTNVLSLVQLGMAAPAIVASYINGATPAVHNNAPRVGSYIVSPAFAGEPSSKTTFRVAGDFWSDVGAGFGTRLDKLNELNRCGQISGNPSTLPSSPSLNCPPSSHE